MSLLRLFDRVWKKSSDVESVKVRDTELNIIEYKGKKWIEWKDVINLVRAEGEEEYGPAREMVLGARRKLLNDIKIGSVPSITEEFPLHAFSSAALSIRSEELWPDILNFLETLGPPGNFVGDVEMPLEHDVLDELSCKIESNMMGRRLLLSHGDTVAIELEKIVKEHFCESGYYGAYLQIVKNGIDGYILGNFGTGMLVIMGVYESMAGDAMDREFLMDRRARSMMARFAMGTGSMSATFQGICKDGLKVEIAKTKNQILGRPRGNKFREINIYKNGVFSGMRSEDGCKALMDLELALSLLKHSYVEFVPGCPGLYADVLGGDGCRQAAVLIRALNLIFDYLDEYYLPLATDNIEKLLIPFNEDFYK